MSPARGCGPRAPHGTCESGGLLTALAALAGRVPIGAGLQPLRHEGGAGGRAGRLGRRVAAARGLTALLQLCLQALNHLLLLLELPAEPAEVAHHQGWQGRVTPIPQPFLAVLCMLQHDTPHATSHWCCKAARSHGVPSPSLGLPIPRAEAAPGHPPGSETPGAPGPPPQEQ